jgi:hypothetical protein
VNNTQISGKKEADIVFLVLGSDPKSTGQEITSQKPNMLNVAMLLELKKDLYNRK